MFADGDSMRGSSQLQGGLSIVDPGAALLGSSQGGLRVDVHVETISGSIAQGRIPNKQTNRGKTELSAKIGGTTDSTHLPLDGKAPFLAIDTTTNIEVP